MKECLDGGVVDCVEVVGDDHDGAAVGAREKEASERTDDLVAAERTVGRRNRAGPWKKTCCHR